jgi:hypothetical protein
MKNWKPRATLIAFSVDVFS